MTISAFHNKIYSYYNTHKRNLPWRLTRDPFKIFVSELMLQQTQSTRVIPKYEAFIEEFPTVDVLAKASTQAVLVHWQGLGYNRRALSLHKSAQIIMHERKGIFPKTYDDLLQLPGIGPYTAHAIMTFAYNKPTVMIETNIRSVFIHFFFAGKDTISDSDLLPYIEKYLDINDPRKWYNALMDYGAMLKSTLPNPSKKSSTYVIQGKFIGSVRQVRGAILKEYSIHPKSSKSALLKKLPYEKNLIAVQYDKLQEEGFFN